MKGPEGSGEFLQKQVHRVLRVLESSYKYKYQNPEVLESSYKYKYSLLMVLESSFIYKYAESPEVLESWFLQIQVCRVLMRVLASSFICKYAES